MLKNTRLQMVAVLGLGAALGWLVASGRFDTLVKSEQSKPQSPVAKSAGDEKLAPCCGEGVCRDALLVKADLPAIAAHNQRVFAKGQEGKKPNILIIWGDDIGWFNPSCYHGGVMGYQTPNIDRIAKEGARFTDWYGQQSCTAGRAAFIMGQSPIRTGMTKVGLPGATLGIQPQDPTIAELLKRHGYACGQFGKNHLGDRNEFLP